MAAVTRRGWRTQSTAHAVSREPPALAAARSRPRAWPVFPRGRTLIESTSRFVAPTSSVSGCLERVTTRSHTGRFGRPPPVHGIPAVARESRTAVVARHRPECGSPCRRRPRPRPQRDAARRRFNTTAGGSIRPPQRRLKCALAAARACTSALTSALRRQTPGRNEESAFGRGGDGWFNAASSRGLTTAPRRADRSAIPRSRAGGSLISGRATRACLRSHGTQVRCDSARPTTGISWLRTCSLSSWRVAWHGKQSGGGLHAPRPRRTSSTVTRASGASFPPRPR